MLRFLPSIIGLALWTPSVPAQERVSETREGVTVTLPAEEADLAKPFLGIAKVWHKAFTDGKFSRAFQSYVENPDAAKNSQKRYAFFLGMEEGPDEAMNRDWEEAATQVQQVIKAWENWEKGFTTMNFWTKEEAETRQQRNQLIFPDTAVEVRSDGAGFRIWPSFLASPVDFDALPPLDEVNPMQLDFVLAYPVGARPGDIARQYHDLLNPSIADAKKGVVLLTAAETYEMMGREVLERALERRVVSGEAGAPFRRALSFGYQASLNDQIDPDRGRSRLFGSRIRRIGTREWTVPISELDQRIRKTSPWPADSDGFAEQMTREVALAMVFLSLKNGGESINHWIQAQQGPLDAEAFAARLQVASGNEGWEQIFARYCGGLADQFTKSFEETAPPEESPRLSEIERQWPSAVSGRVEVISPPDLAETAALAAGKVDAILDEISAIPASPQTHPLSEAHLEKLASYGVIPKDRSPEIWQNIYQDLIRTSPQKLQVRLWFVDELLSELKKGTLIPGAELDPIKGEVTLSSTLVSTQQFRKIDPDGTSAGPSSHSSIIIPFPREEAAILASEFEALTIARKCREDLEDFSEATRRTESEEEQFFLLASNLIGETLLRDVIASKDREWFVIGFTNWLAIQLTDAEFGAGAGNYVFSERWPVEKNEANREKVDLTSWKSPEEENEDQPFAAEHAYFATVAMTAALEGKDADFVRQFLDEIRKTPRKRANLGTVYRAYKAVGGGNLKAHAQKAVAGD